MTHVTSIAYESFHASVLVARRLGRVMRTTTRIGVHSADVRQTVTRCLSAGGAMGRFMLLQAPLPGGVVSSGGRSRIG